jgi:UDP-2,3-diacylglucosamine pyrophosphatase LpxH
MRIHLYCYVTQCITNNALQHQILSRLLTHTEIPTEFSPLVYLCFGDDFTPQVRKTPNSSATGQILNALDFFSHTPAHHFKKRSKKIRSSRRVKSFGTKEQREAFLPTSARIFAESTWLK